VSYKTWTLTVAENAGPVASTTWPSYFTNKSTTSKTSTPLTFGFQITGAQLSDYTVVFSGGENINVATPVTTAYSASSNNYRADWWSSIAPKAEGFYAGTGTITATVTHKGTGHVFTKTWTLTVAENTGPVASATWASYFTNKSTTSKTSTPLTFGFQINNAQLADYTVVFSGGESINVATPTTTAYSASSNSYRADWWSNIAPNAEGFYAGTGTITATATHKGTGHVFTKTWTLTVTENAGPVASQTWASYFSNKTAAAGSTGGQVFGFQINNAQLADYTVVFSGGENINAGGAKATTAYSASSNNYRADWWTTVTPGTGGFTSGTGTITATATHKATGHVFTKTWTLTIP
jgi:hypothetical protein